MDDLDAFFRQQQARFQATLDADFERLRTRLREYHEAGLEVVETRGSTTGPCVTYHPRTEDSDE